MGFQDSPIPGTPLKAHSDRRITTDETAAEIDAYGSCLCLLKRFVRPAEQGSILEHCPDTINSPTAKAPRIK